MKRRRALWGMLIAGSLGLALGATLVAWTTGWLAAGEVTSADIQLEPERKADLAVALDLLHTARARLAPVAGYRCTYLRDEWIDGSLQANHLTLTIRHVPFSVALEWHDPPLKRGRRAIWIDGRHGGQMLVRQAFLRMQLDPVESIRRKESRHTIREAGLANLIERLSRSWQAELNTGAMAVAIHQGDLQVRAGQKAYRHVCHVVVCRHAAAARERFTFGAIKVFFDQASGLPIRFEGYDWPGSDTPEGRLLERYTYLNLDTTVRLTDQDFVP